MPPRITHGNVTSTDEVIQEYQTSSVHFTQYRVDQTRKTTDNFGEVTTRTDFWRENRPHLRTHSKARWVNVANYTTDNKRSRRVITDELKLSVGEDLYEVMHSALGVRATDVFRQHDKRWLTAVTIPPPLEIDAYIGVVAGALAYYINGSLKATFGIAIGVGILCHLSFRTLHWLRTRLLVRSREQALRMIRQN